MFKDLKNRLLNGWHFMRVLRFALAGLILVQAWISADLLFAAIAGVLMFQALFDFGCCGTSGCYTEPAARSQDSQHDISGKITYEEVKKS